jgi:hypothetical protein
VFELVASLPRYALTAPSSPLSDEQALAHIADSRQPLLDGKGLIGSVEVLKYRPGKVLLKTTADVPTTLRVADRWDPDWKATVDGSATKVDRVDYLCQGVSLPAGTHIVKLSYSPSFFFFYLQVAGLVALLGAAFLSRK